jgi:hypothetical protein
MLLMDLQNAFDSNVEKQTSGLVLAGSISHNECEGCDVRIWKLNKRRQTMKALLNLKWQGKTPWDAQEMSAEIKERTKRAVEALEYDPVEELNRCDKDLDEFHDFYRYLRDMKVH